MWHGVNPAMGWLFAVALGFQEQRRGAVWRALGPLALGHAVAIGAALLVALAIGAVLPLAVVRWSVAIALVGMGVYRILRGRHPRYGSMRVSSLQLAIWSFLMATAHGAGLMLVPLVLDLSPGAMTSGHPSGPGLTLVHTAAYLIVAGALASLVYGRWGVRRLRELWVNLDLVWGVALVLTGAVTPWL